MRTNSGLWWLLAGAFLLFDIVYVGWGILARPDLPWYETIEWVGAPALLLAAIMATMIAFYVQRVHRAQGGELPSDILTADVDDGDPEAGEFSPWSWWPIVLASAAAVAVLGLAVGTWMLPIGLGIFVVAIVGWVYEYYRGYFAH